MKLKKSLKEKIVPKKTISIKESYFIKSVNLAKLIPNKIALMVLFNILNFKTTKDLYI